MDAAVRRQRAKRTSLTALALVAILAGVAVAYFLTNTKFAGNKAVGGQLTVEATLPLDFTDTPLYPTTPPPGAYNPLDDPATADPQRYVDEQVNGQPEHDFDYVEKDFDINNNNPVKAEYTIYATCAECIADANDTPEQQTARDEKRDQFNNLYVTIYDGTKTYYTGRLAELSPTNKKSLGKIEGDGGSNTYTVRLWLQDNNQPQPQQVLNTWEFFLEAKTPTA